MDKIKFGQFLASLRENSKMTQDNASLLLNIKRQTLSRWERGDSLPDLESLYNLADIYHISVEELLNSCYDIKYKTRDDLILKQKKEIEKLNTDFNKQKKLVEEKNLNEKKHKKKVKSVFVGILVLFVALIVALVILFLNNINKNILIYTIRGDHHLLNPVEGILFKSKEEMHLFIGNITGINQKISNIKLYYLDENNNKNIILETPYNIINFKDYWGYNEFIDFDKFDNYLNNLYIEFTVNEKIEFVRLLINEDYNNNKWKFKKQSKISKDLLLSDKENVVLPEYDDLVKKIEKKYNKSNDGYWFNYSGYSFSFMSIVLSVYNKNEEYFVDFTTGKLSYFDHFDSNNNFDSAFIELNCSNQKCMFQNQKIEDFWGIVNESFGNLK